MARVGAMTLQVLTLYHSVEVKVFLKQVTCSKLFTALLSSLVIFDPHLQWFLKLACEYSKLILSNLSNTANIHFPPVCCANTVCSSRSIFSPAWEGLDLFLTEE